MPNYPQDVSPVAAPPKRTSTATKLLQAAALAAVLVPLGSVAIEADTIRCVSQSGGGCSGGVGGYGHYEGGGGWQWNNWEFYTDDGYTDLFYMFEIAGAPTTTFDLDVRDEVTTQPALVAGGFLANFPNLKCVPIYDVGECSVFHVDVLDPPALWDPDGYQVTIRWYANHDPLSRPPADSFVTILQARDGTGGVFGNVLDDIWYDDNPGLGDEDPAIGGRGNGFSDFTVAANPVPEPASMILFGTGLAGAIYRARRRKRQL